MASLQPLLLLLLSSTAWLLLAPGGEAVAVDCGTVFQTTLSQLATLTRECPEASFRDCCQVRERLELVVGSFYWASVET